MLLVIFPISTVYAIGYCIIVYDKKGTIEYLNKFFHSIALSLDQLGNVVCQHLFNMLFIKNLLHPFGNPDKTVSSVLGINKINNNLTWIGKILDFILEKIDSGHTIESIDI